MLLLEQKRRKGMLDTIHFIGIGGIGMSGIAEIMHNMGYRIQGSDLSSNSNTERLAIKGIKVFQDHDSHNISGVSYVVISSAVKSDNPEVIAARKNNIPVIRRAEMLAELMRLKSSVAISGSHGKTTTTSLVSCLFEAAGLEPTVINGGIINRKATNAYLGRSDYLIAEADESDATFINIPSTIGIITNIDKEHMDFYKNFENLQNAFKSFITNLPFYGFGVLCIDHPVVRKIANEIKERKIITYGIDSSDAHIRAVNIKSDVSSSSFDVIINLPSISGTTTIENVVIPTPGRHNVLNSLAAISVGVELDFGIKVIKQGFSKFEGVKRRFTKLGKVNNAEIIDDYAHHPAELQATLATAKSIANTRNSRVIAIFQPHRYTRLSDLFDEFVKSFDDADHIYITDVYAAGEDPIKGATSDALVTALKKEGKTVERIYALEEIEDKVKEVAKDGDLVMMMGAGSISAYANSFVAKNKNE